MLSLCPPPPRTQAKQNAANPNLVCMLIGNKADLESQRKVSKTESKAFADANGMSFVELTAKNLAEVEQVSSMTLRPAPKSVSQIMHLFWEGTATQVVGVKRSVWHILRQVFLESAQKVHKQIQQNPRKPTSTVRIKEQQVGCSDTEFCSDAPRASIAGVS